MKTIILFLFLSLNIFAQGKFTLFDSEVADPYGEELITNSTFDSNIDGWTQYAGLEFNTFEWSSSQLHIVSTGTRGLAGSNSFAVESGKTYRVLLSITITSGTLDGAYINQYAFNNLRMVLGTAISTNTEIDVLYECVHTGNVHITFDATNPFNCLVDNVSVKEVLNP